VNRLVVFEFKLSTKDILYNKMANENRRFRAVLAEVDITGWRIRDKPTGSLSTMSTSLPVDTRVQKKGGGV
jgi:hypothetical protein